MLNAPKSPLLDILERLAALSNEEGGLVKIKPFRDWKGSTWQNKIFTMRLLNAGEMLEVYEYCSKFTGNAKEQAYYIEILIRSLYSVDGVSLAPEEEVAKYNKACNVNLSKLEYLRLWAGNLEQIVVLRLHSIYDQLQLKQIRLVNDQYLCEASGVTYDSLPEGCRKIKYGIGEILAKEVLQDNSFDKSVYDFEDTDFGISSFTPPENVEAEIEKLDNAKNAAEWDYYCGCGEGFNTFEEFNKHREKCTEAN